MLINCILEWVHNERTTYQNLWDAAKGVFRGIFIAVFENQKDQK